MYSELIIWVINVIKWWFSAPFCQSAVKRLNVILFYPFLKMEYLISKGVFPASHKQIFVQEGGRAVASSIFSSQLLDSNT